MLTVRTDTTALNLVPFHPPLHRSFWLAQIVRARQAIRLGHSGSKSALACTIFAAYKHGHDTGGLSEALVILRRLHMHSGTREDVNAQVVLDLGDMLHAEYQRTGDINLIGEMMDVLRTARLGGPAQATQKCQIAVALLERCAYFGDKADLLEAKVILDMVPTTESNLRLTLALAIYHITRWDALSQYDFNELQRLKNNLIYHLQQESPIRRTPSTLAVFLRVCFLLCYQRSPEVVQNAMAIIREAVETDPCSFPPSDLFAAWTALANFYVNLARDTCDRADLETAEGILKRMSPKLASRSPLDQSKVHACVGHLLIGIARISKLTDIGTLTQAAVEFRNALRLLPSSHIHRRQNLTSLTYILAESWQHSGRRSCLDEIITLADQNPGQTTNTRFIINVTDGMLQRAEAGRLRTVSILALLKRAVDLLKVTLAATLETSRLRGYLLKHLSWAYRLQTNYGVSVDQDERLRVATSITAKLSSNHERNHIPRAALARVLLDVAISSHNLEALEQSVAIVDQLPHSRGSEESVVVLKARCYAARYRLLGDPQDLERCKDTVQAALLINDTMTYCLRDAISCLTIAQSLRDVNFASRICRHIVTLLPRLAHVGQDIETRVQALQLAEGLASRAAGVALSSGDICGAVELLEQSRGVVWSQALHLRASSTSVPAQYREQFERIAESLSQATHGTTANTSERWGDATEFEDVVAQIRKVEGYERFLLPRLYQEIAACAIHGFVVLVIPSEVATDVVVISDRDSAPRHLQISGLTLSRVQNLTTKLNHMSNRNRERKLKFVDARSRKGPENEYTEVLAELWTNLVHPVIVDLGIEACAQNTQRLRPRLWWCPTGSFAELPLHAAGIYQGLNEDCLSNYVVPSYTPTLSALISAQEQPVCSSTEGMVILSVSVPEASGLVTLPNALVEASCIAAVVPRAHLSSLTDSDASISNVLHKLPDATVLHLACHGHQSQDDPLTSGFSLHDGRLQLEQLMQLQLPSAKLAYLSACETASTDEYQPDEAINLAATMLFVGFKSVIATMWSMNDIDGPFIAERVYRAIFREGKLDLAAVPYALDAAVRELRAAGTDPSRWATYVHIGA